MGFKSVSIRDRPLYHVHLNREFRSDLQWWALLADKVEWEQLLIAILPGKPDVTIYSDTSRSWGYGAYANPLWCQGQWPPPPSA